MLPPSAYGNADIPVEEETLLQSMSDEEIAAGVARGSITYLFEQRLREENALITRAIDAENDRKKNQAEESRKHFQEVSRIALERSLRHLSGEQLVPEELPSGDLERDWCGTSRFERILDHPKEPDSTDTGVVDSLQ